MYWTLIYYSLISNGLIFFFFLLRRNFYGISLELAYFLLFFLACTFSRKKNHCKMYSEISTDKKTTTSFILIFALFLWNCTHTFHFRFIWIFFFLEHGTNLRAFIVIQEIRHFQTVSKHLVNKLLNRKSNHARHFSY